LTERDMTLARNKATFAALADAIWMVRAEQPAPMRSACDTRRQKQSLRLLGKRDLPKRGTRRWELGMASAVLEKRESTLSDVVRAGLIAGIAAAVVEMIPVLLIQGLMLHVSPVRIFQSIASGLMGKAAYAGGIGSALLGGLVHTAISLVAGLIFAFAANLWRMLLARPVLAGLGYGIIVYIVMSYLVLPLSAVAFKPATNPALIAMSVTIHMVAFALPISLICWRRLGTTGLLQPSRPRRTSHL
jgi:hypothetical protein